jgi:uncharacterized surface protein with fasciclin (FAS1) repeats
MKIKSLLMAMVACAVMITACDELASDDVVSKMSSDPDLQALAAAVKAAGLEEQLKSTEGITLFAPNNTALGTLPTDITGDKLVNLLKYHVATTAIAATPFARDTSFASLLGTDHPIHFSRELKDGVAISTINGVSSNTNTIRVFFPAMKGNAKIVKTIEAENGTIHVIDAILYNDAELTIVEAAAKHPQSRTVLLAVATALGAGAGDVIGTNAPLNVAPLISLLAPNNATLAAVSGTLPTAFLPAVLGTHIFPGVRIATGALTNGATFTPATNATVTVTVNSGNILLSTAYMGTLAANDPGRWGRIAVAGIQAKNGNLHIIQGILLPQAPPAAS